VTSSDLLLGCHVLLVEDDADLRAVLEMALEAAGAAVISASSAAEALAALVTKTVDVVVSDIAMPEQSGFWLVTKVRQVFPQRHVPVLAITGLPFPGDGVRRAGFDDVMQKPPDPGALCAAVASLRQAYA
jgi:CheY-like chemotaxis protein